MNEIQNLEKAINFEKKYQFVFKTQQFIFKNIYNIK